MVCGCSSSWQIIHGSSSSSKISKLTGVDALLLETLLEADVAGCSHNILSPISPGGIALGASGEGRPTGIPDHPGRLDVWKVHQTDSLDTREHGNKHLKLLGFCKTTVSYYKQIWGRHIQLLLFISCKSSYCHGNCYYLISCKSNYCHGSCCLWDGKTLPFFCTINNTVLVTYMLYTALHQTWDV